MSRSRRLSRLWNAISSVLRSERAMENILPRRSRRRPEGIVFELCESRLLFNGYEPATISASISTTNLYEGSCVTVSVSADGGTDPINSYTAAWGDGTTSDLNSAYGDICHTYNDNGLYSVVVTPNGYCEYTNPSWDVTVSNVAPTAYFSVPNTANEGDPVAWNFDSAYDPSWADSQAGFHYSVAFDSGGLANSYDAAAQSSEITFPDDGSYTVYGRIFDQDGGCSTYSTSVSVNGVAPTATFSVGSAPVFEGDWVVVSLLEPTDPSSDDRTAGYWYSFSRDGNYSTPSTSNSAGLYFEDNGAFRVSARIYDQDGAYTEYWGNEFTVGNLPPTGYFNVSIPSSDEGTCASVSFSSPSDPSPVDAQSLQYSFALSEAGLAESWNCACPSMDCRATWVLQSRWSWRIISRRQATAASPTVLCTERASRP